MKNEDLYNEEPTHGDPNEMTREEYLAYLEEKRLRLINETGVLVWDPHTNTYLPNTNEWHELLKEIAQVSTVPGWGGAVHGDNRTKYN